MLLALSNFLSVDELHFELCCFSFLLTTRGICFVWQQSMSSPSSQLATLRRMTIYKPFHPTMWGDTILGDASLNNGSSTVVQVDTKLDNKTEYLSDNLMEPSRSDQEANKPSEKAERRLAQNREAARKSRLRKKAYVQQLESSHLKLAQLEQELVRVRHQGMYTGGASDGSNFGQSGHIAPGITTFEVEYSHWVDEHNRQIGELRNKLQAHITDIELRILVENAVNHFNNLFLMKADAAKADVFYLISGMWRTPTERFFQWIGGFRPSELLNILMPQLEPLTEQQQIDVCSLRLSCQQAEDALSQGIDKLQQTLVQSITEDQLSSGSYQLQMVAAAEKLEALENFVNQADHLRQQTMQQMYRVLTTRQSARALLALGEYIHRLRALSSLWAARPREPT